MHIDLAALEPLPRGRHGLSRDQVTESQRTRLLQAAVSLGIEQGFASLTLADIVGRARVARSTFYEHFDDKDQCFLAAFDLAADRVLEHVLEVEVRADQEPTTLISVYMQRLIDLGLQEPILLQLVAADASLLRPEAAERQRAMRVRMARGVVAMRELMRLKYSSMQPVTELRALAIIGAIIEMMRHTIHTDGIEHIVDLHDELTTVVVTLLEADRETRH